MTANFVGLLRGQKLKYRRQPRSAIAKTGDIRSLTITIRTTSDSEILRYKLHKRANALNESHTVLSVPSRGPSQRTFAAGLDLAAHPVT